DIDNDDEEEEAELTVLAAMALLAIVTGLTGVCAEFLVSSIDGLTTQWNLSPSFVGMILLPIVGNAAEHVTAVTVAIRNKMDLALGVAVGSSIQIALFVMPFLCILGWIIGQPLTIYFSPFTTVVLFVTVLLVNYIIGDGRTNWLEGLVLLVAYIIIGVAYFLYPKNMDTSALH
ncbi:Vacuolar membrane antiporter with Ca2+/H+ and K+/H+ exchange activity protein, partial [Coemansia sp. RSA 1836]